MINLILADDHKVVRQALSEMLEAKGNFKVVAQAENGAELLDVLSEHSADIVIMDMVMPEMDGITTLEELKNSENPPVLILSSDEGQKSIRSALLAGAKGYIPKNIDASELVFAIESILAGKTYLSPSITAPLMMGGFSPDSLENGPLSVLTKREIEIMGHLANGKPNRVIGKELHISTRTVDTHRSNIMKKLKIKTNAQLVKLAIQHGLIEV